MVSKEQRAHDIAIAMLGSFDKSKTEEFVNEYFRLYDECLRLIQKEYEKRVDSFGAQW